MERDDHFSFRRWVSTMDSLDDLRARNQAIVKDSNGNLAKDHKDIEKPPLNYSMSSSGYESFISERSTVASSVSTPVPVLVDEDLDILLDRFAIFLSRLKPSATPVASSYIPHAFRLTDLLNWFIDDLFTESQRDQGPTGTPRPQAFKAFRQLLKKIGLSAPASITLPPSQVVDLLLEWESDRRLDELFKKPIDDEQIGDDRRMEKPNSDLSFEAELDQNDHMGQMKMISFLCDIGLELAENYTEFDTSTEAKDKDPPMPPEKILEHYACPVRLCKYTSTSLLQLHDHRRHPHKRHGWHCALCEGFTTNQIVKLEQHYIEIHGYTSAIIREKRLRPVFCIWCAESFDKRRLERHLRQGCPAAPDDDHPDGQLIFSVMDDGDLLNTELWPKCQRTRPYWLSLPPKGKRTSVVISPALQFNTEPEYPTVVANEVTISSIKPLRTLLPIVKKMDKHPPQNLPVPAKKPVNPVFSFRRPHPEVAGSVSRTPFSLENYERRDEIIRLLSVSKNKEPSSPKRTVVVVPARQKMPVVEMESSERKRNLEDLGDLIDTVVKRQRLSVESDKAATTTKNEEAAMMVKTLDVLAPSLEDNNVEMRVKMMDAGKKTETKSVPLMEKPMEQVKVATTQMLSVEKVLSAAMEKKQKIKAIGGQNRAIKTIDRKNQEIKAFDRTNQAIKVIDQKGRVIKVIDQKGQAIKVVNQPIRQVIMAGMKKPEPPTVSQAIKPTDSGTMMVDSATATTPKPPTAPAPAAKSSRQQFLSKWLMPVLSTVNEAAKTPRRPERKVIEFPYSCDQCGSKFLTQAAAHRHLVSRHWKKAALRLCRVDSCDQCIGNLKLEGIKTDNSIVSRSEVSSAEAVIARTSWEQLCNPSGEI